MKAWERPITDSGPVALVKAIRSAGVLTDEISELVERNGIKPLALMHALCSMLALMKEQGSEELFKKYLELTSD